MTILNGPTTGVDFKTLLALRLWFGMPYNWALLFARIAVESELSTRAQRPTEWPDCPVCGRRYRSKGVVSRRPQHPDW